MTSQNLTALKIDSIRPTAQRQEIADSKQHGLYVIVQPSGRRSFAIRTRFDGKPIKLTLQAGVSLADARKLAADAMFDIAKGIDPRAAKKAEKQIAESARTNTLRNICERYLKREGGKLRTADTRERTLKRLVYPSLGERQIDSIKRTEITQLLDVIEDQNGARAADLVLSYLRKVFNWYAVQSDTFMSPIVSGMSRYSISDNRRTRHLNDDEIKALWQGTEDGSPLSSLFRFLLLTGARRSEAAGLRWDEINGNAWLLPASRHKNKKIDLLRPLSKAALDIIDAQPKIDSSPFVFTNTGKHPIAFGGSSGRALKKLKIAESWCPHDLRRTARTLLSRCKVDSDLAEKALGHLPGAIRATYDQHKYQDELLEAFEKLATQIRVIVDPPPANVTPMRRRG